MNDTCTGAVHARTCTGHLCVSHLCWQRYRWHTCNHACVRVQSRFYSYDEKSKYDYKEEKVDGAADANIGFFEEFDIDPDTPLESAQRKLQRLQKDMWINAGTAWLRTDFVTYNSNLGLFCFVKFTFEILNTGEIRPSFRANAMRARLYSTPGEIIQLIFELITIFCWLIFVIRIGRLLALEWRATKQVMPFFKDFDHMLESVQVLNSRGGRRE
jgi:hypothetical protein